MSTRHVFKQALPVEASLDWQQKGVIPCFSRHVSIILNTLRSVPSRERLCRDADDHHFPLEGRDRLESRTVTTE
jgi:hypothetical protein